MIGNDGASAYETVWTNIDKTADRGVGRNERVAANLRVVIYASSRP